MILARMTGRLLGRGLAGLVALIVGVALFELMQAPVVASFGGAVGITALIESLPPAFQAVARTRPEFTTMAGLAGSLSAGFTHPLYIVLTLAAIVGLVSRSLAGEMERGTILLTLSRPVSRAKLYASRVLGLVIVCLLLVVASIIGLVAGLALARPDGELDYRNLLPLAIASFLLFWAIGGLALLASAAASTSGRVVGWAIGFVVVSYFVDYFAAIWTFLEPFAFLSIFNYFDPALALSTGEVPWRSVAVLGLVGLVGIVGGLVIFDRRDLPA
jgi:ABC-2 type transport system permease protein